MFGKKWKFLLQFARIGCMMVSVLGLSACGAGKSGLSEEALMETLSSMTGYQAQVEITFYSNKGENVYQVMQYADSAGRYRMEILQPDTYQGVTTVCDGERVIQRDPDIGGVADAKESPVRGVLVLFGFLKAYEADEGHIFEMSEDGSDTAVLTAVQPDTNVIQKLCLTVDAKTAQPQLLELKGAQDQILIRIEYQTFDRNPELSDSLFETK